MGAGWKADLRILRSVWQLRRTRFGRSCEPRMNADKDRSSFEVRVPGSTSNLGSGFDCFGLALKLYLTVGATVVPNASEPCRVTTSGAKENEALPRNAVNLIYRAMSFAARREAVSLLPVELTVPNE